MSTKKRFLLRIDPRLHASLEKWAADELRSLNAQIEFLLMEAARRAGRWAIDKHMETSDTPDEDPLEDPS